MQTTPGLTMEQRTRLMLFVIATSRQAARSTELLGAARGYASAVKAALRRVGGTARAWMTGSRTPCSLVLYIDSGISWHIETAARVAALAAWLPSTDVSVVDVAHEPVRSETLVAVVPCIVQVRPKPQRMLILRRSGLHEVEEFLLGE
jgi:hypothetical protein